MVKAVAKSKKTVKDDEKVVKKTRVKNVKVEEKVEEKKVAKATKKVSKTEEKPVAKSVKKAEKTAEKKVANVTKNDVVKKATKGREQVEKKSAKNVIKKAEVNEKTVAKKTAKKAEEALNSDMENLSEAVFYYERRQIVLLTVVYAAVACLMYIVANASIAANVIVNWGMVVWQSIVMILTLLAFAGVVFVLLFPQKMAVISDKGIKIDHNQLLLWKDVKKVEEKRTGFVMNRQILVFELKKGALEKYKLTFMQRLCKHNVFTPFSIPLYAMDETERVRICESISKYVTIKK